MTTKQSISNYLGLTFLASWSCWLVVAFLTHYVNMKLFSPICLPFYSLGAAGPLIGAWITNRKLGNKEDLRKFTNSIFNLKRPVTAYLIIIVLAWGFCFFPTLTGASLKQAPLYTALFQLPIMIFFGGGLEEVGWRGFLLPQLQKKFSNFVSTCILAIIWTFWHLPLWLVKGSGQDTIKLSSYLILVFSLSFILTFLWNRYESIALCILMHAAFNSFTDVYPPNYNNLPTSLLLLVVCLLFFVITDFFTRRNTAEIGKK